MKRILSDFGYNFEVVKEQIEPDGNFPTVVYANPEEVAAFKLGTKLGNEIGAQLILANDPDADRIGIAIRGVATKEEVNKVCKYTDKCHLYN